MNRNHSNSGNPNHASRAVDPTPAQIRQRCQLIREEWTEATRRRRAGEVVQHWTVPVISRFSIHSIGETHHN